MPMNPEQMRPILEAAIMVAGRPLSVNDLLKLFDGENKPSAKEIREVLETLQQHYANSGVELRELASGFQFQAKVELSQWLSHLWEERPPKYSRAILETLALIAYRQPITRAEIEEIRGVAVSTHIVKTLQDREWVRVIGYRDVPGKPALYATTKAFLDHLSLKSLDELPTLAEIKDLESQEEKLQIQLELATASETEKEIDSETTENHDMLTLSEETLERENETETEDETEILVELETESEEVSLETSEIDE